MGLRLSLEIGVGNIFPLVKGLLTFTLGILEGKQLLC